MAPIRDVIFKWFNPLNDTVVKETRQEGAQVFEPCALEQSFLAEAFPSAYQDFEKAPSASVPSPDGFFNSISLRFGGFEKKFNMLIAPLDEFFENDETVRQYFAYDLSPTVELASRQPQTARRLLAGKAVSGTALYERLVAVACGNSQAVLPVIDTVSRSRNINEPLLLDCLRQLGRYRPYETGHILTSFFGRATLKTRLQILRELVHSPLLGDKHMVGDLFVALMAQAAPEERQEEIYPHLKAIIGTAPAQTNAVKVKSGYLAALLHGWMSENNA